MTTLNIIGNIIIISAYCSIVALLIWAIVFFIKERIYIGAGAGIIVILIMLGGVLSGI